ncbi:hypothetical protein LAWI1_G001533 [Lachnellula willkommii]|uniref:DUF6594 domain-containing protein n=1 Tax=Lachnellula willkommii TaxID=215461 RepID=A0A559MHY5_9HELO|nr:hypothetical protein LAWI1_G001533 [Lachnellula willkommii]
MSSTTDPSISLEPVPSTTPTSHQSTSRASTSTSNPISASSITTEQLTEEEIETKPWKYIGYKGYADFLASENDFFIFRKFASLNCRVALSLQDQLSVLESDLDDIDTRYSKKNAGDINNGSFRDDREDRTELVEKISQKLAQYNSFMIQQTQLKAYPQAYRPDVKSLRAWHANHGSVAIVPAEQDYLAHDSDLFCAAPKQKTPLRRFLDRSLAFRILPLWRQDEPGLPSYDKDLIFSISDKRIDRFITCLILGIGTAMLIAPIWILEVMTRPVRKLIVITVFIVAFLAMVSAVTVAKPFETLAATAAYSAVLMVFLQLGNSNGP